MDLKTLQKLRFFLASAFPVLTRLPPFTAKAHAWLDQHPRLKARLTQMRESRFAASVRRVSEMLVVGDYDGDRIDDKIIPAETMGTLRGTVILAVALSLLVPVAVLVVWPALSLEQISGTAGAPVAGWSVVLWMAGAALAWACLLVATGLANRFALPLAMAVFAYFNLVLTTTLPRSWWALALFGAMIAATLGGELRAAARPGTRAWPGLVACILNGMMAGFLGLATSPAGALFKGRVLYMGAGAGAVLGVLLWGLARVLARRKAGGDGAKPPWPRADVLVAVIAGLHFAFTVSLAIRGGLLAPAQGLHPVAVQMPGYLWPLYYFIGVGLIFKVLRQTKLIHGTMQELVPPRVLVPLGLTFLVGATVIGWSEVVLLQPGRAWLPGLEPAATWITGLTPWLWRQPLWGMTMEWMRWAFVIVLGLALWAAVRRRLTGEVMAMLLFPTVLLWLAIAQYFFEFSSFGGSPRVSAASLLAFSIFILWLSHMSMRQFVAGDSPGWPRAARVVLYGAALMLVLLPVHARAAMHDPKLVHEILLYLFTGILDLGLPFYLHLYARRNFQRMPFTAVQLLACFGLGAALSVPFTILDKMAVSAWSFDTVWTTVNAQVQSLVQHGRALEAFTPLPSPAWLVVRALLAWGAILAIGVFVHRRMAGREMAPAATVVAVLALATGLACFANRTLELPLLPPAVVQLLTPARVSRAVDVALMARYLSFVIPALVVGLALISSAPPRWRRVAIGAAVSLHVGITWLWPAQEPWLRSTGVLATAGAAGGLALFVLVVVMRDRLAAVLLLREKPGGVVRLLYPRELRLAASLGFAGLLALGAWQIFATRLVARTVPGQAAPLPLPAVWRDAPAAGGVATWHGPLQGTAAPLLQVTTRPGETGNPRAVLQAAANERARELSGFALAGLESWDLFVPGALALEFHFERQVQGAAVPLMGTLVVAPAGPETVFVFTVLYELGDRDRRWDVLRALRNRAP
ncbi:MAG: hypothetical protein JNL92_05195 [Opitutaceae bacterium]|nr:hypothetical protein [Opitutaceae bacterium]